MIMISDKNSGRPRQASAGQASAGKTSAVHASGANRAFMIMMALSVTRQGLHDHDGPLSDPEAL